MKNLILTALLFFKNLFCKNESQPEPVPNIEEGKTYRHTDNLCLYHVTKLNEESGTCDAFGLDWSGEMIPESEFGDIKYLKNRVEVDYSELIKVIREEASKKGYMEGNFINLGVCTGSNYPFYSEEKWTYIPEVHRLFTASAGCGGAVLFHAGKFAEKK